MSPANGSPCYLSALGLVNALGIGKILISEGLFAGNTSGMVLEEDWLPGGPARVGRANISLPEIPQGFENDISRNNRLLLSALEEIRTEVDAEIARWGRDRVGIVLGTST